MFANDISVNEFTSCHVILCSPFIAALKDIFANFVMKDGVLSCTSYRLAER